MARGLSMPVAVARGRFGGGTGSCCPPDERERGMAKHIRPLPSGLFSCRLRPRLATLARAHESRIQGDVHEVARHRHAVSGNRVRSVVVHPFPLVASRVVGKRQLGTMTAVDPVVLLVTALPNALAGDATSLGGGLVGAIVVLLPSAAGGRVPRENVDRERLSYPELRGEERRRRGGRARRDRRGGRRSERDPPAPGGGAIGAAVSCRRRSG